MYLFDEPRGAAARAVMMINASAQCGAMLKSLLHMRASCGVIITLRCQGCDSWELPTDTAWTSSCFDLASRVQPLWQLPNHHICCIVRIQRVDTGVTTELYIRNAKCRTWAFTDVAQSLYQGMRCCSQQCSDPNKATFIRQPPALNPSWIMLRRSDQTVKWARSTLRARLGAPLLW